MQTISEAIMRAYIAGGGNAADGVMHWCPIEAGLIGRLADLECQHRRMPGDASPACECWPDETA